MQLKHADKIYSKLNELLLNLTDILKQPGKETVINIKLHVYTENELTDIIQAHADLEVNDDVIICPAVTTTETSH